MATSQPQRDVLPMLPCTPACKIAQRNARFANALGLASGARSEEVYAPELVRYARAEKRAVVAVQDALSDFIQSPRAAVLLRAQLQQLSVRTGVEMPRVSIGLLEFVQQLAPVYGLETELCTEQGEVRMGAMPTLARGTDLRLRRTRAARIPSVLLSEYLVRHPGQAKIPAPSSTSAPAQAFNAVLISGLSPSIDDASLETMLAPATLAGRRRWRAERVSESTVVLCEIQLEPQSIAAIAGGTSQGTYAALSPSERRLGRVADEVHTALRQTPQGKHLQAELAAFVPGARRVERVHSRATWRGT